MFSANLWLAILSVPGSVNLWLTYTSDTMLCLVGRFRINVRRHLWEHVRLLMASLCIYNIRQGATHNATTYSPEGASYITPFLYKKWEKNKMYRSYVTIKLRYLINIKHVTITTKAHIINYNMNNIIKYSQKVHKSSHTTQSLKKISKSDTIHIL